MPQVKELLSNYGHVAVWWWDTPTGMNSERAEKLLPLLKLQPGIVSNNRLDKNKSTGDFETPEQKIPATGLPLCATAPRKFFKTDSPSCHRSPRR